MNYVQLLWYLAFLSAGFFIGGLMGNRKKQTEYVDSRTADEVRECMYRAGAVKSEVEGAMVEMRKVGIVFFKRAE